MGFRDALRTQRWDDHRYYHHSRINQALHLVSAISFVCAYIMVWTHPVAAVLLAWLFGMTSRQIGHFFFEPRDYDEVNRATHEYKEDVKIGYNLQRKVVLMGVWALSPLALYFDQTLFGLFEPHTDLSTFVHHVALMWIAIGIGGLLFRTVHLFFIKDVQTGLVWMTKIVTDPFHDIKTLLQVAALSAAGRADRPHDARAPARRRAEITEASGLLLGGPRQSAAARSTRNRWARISRKMPRRIALLVVDASAHHQPSCLHGPRRRHEAVDHRGEVAVGVVQAEDEPARADPAQGQTLGPQVELQHPVVARRARVADPVQMEDMLLTRTGGPRPRGGR